MPFYKALVMCGLMSVVVGCQRHDNPLLVQDKERVAQYLVHASRAAEKQLGLASDSGGDYYRACMRQRVSHSTCLQLYQAMLRYAKKKSLYPGLVLADLLNPHVMQRVSEQYQRIYFNLM